MYGNKVVNHRKIEDTEPFCLALLIFHNLLFLTMKEEVYAELMSSCVTTPYASSISGFVMEKMTVETTQMKPLICVVWYLMWLTLSSPFVI